MKGIMLVRMLIGVPVMILMAYGLGWVIMHGIEAILRWWDP